MNIRWIRGYVKCNLTGKNIELFINLILNSELEIWDISIIKRGQANFSISVNDYLKIKSFLKRSNTRIHIIEKIGLPFLLNRLKNRLGVLFGIIIFIIIIYLSSSMIWSIDIEGNKTIEESIIYQSLNEIGVSKGIFKKKLPENEYIKEQLMLMLEDISWVGVNREGTKLQITIVEKIKPKEKEIALPSNIISKKDAVIYKILAEKGISQVKISDRVKRGDILISGIIGNEERSEIIAAKGIVQGIVWYKSSITISLKQKWKEYTGNKYEQNYLVLGNRMIKFKGYDIIHFEQYQIVNDWKQVYFNNFKLPVGILTKKSLEYIDGQRTLSEEEAYIIAFEQTKKYLCSKIDSDSKIINEKIISKNFKDGRLTVEILYEVIEDITATQLIIQGE
ncbi:MAG: sporulation protein YqfD [Vulcanibacillus sp.]